MKQHLIEFEYGPCHCPAYRQAHRQEELGIVKGGDGEPGEFYEFPDSAARAFFQALREGKEPRVHIEERHIIAVWIDGKRYDKETGSYVETGGRDGDA